MLAPLLVVAVLAAYLLRDGLFPGLGQMFGVSYHATLEGRVVAGPDARPLAGATITIGRLSVVSDERGAFEISDDNLRRRRLQLEVQKESYQKRALEVAIDQERLAVGDIRLLKEFFVSGRVQSRDMNAAVPAATIRVERDREDGGPIVGRSAADGSYRLGPVYEGRRFDLVFDHPAYLPVERKNLVIRRPADNAPQDVVLAVGAVLSGVTRARNGEGLPRVHVIVYQENPDGSLGAVEKAGLSGWDATFLIQGISPGPKRIVGETPDGRREAPALRVKVPEAGEVVNLKLIYLEKKDG